MISGQLSFWPPEASPALVHSPPPPPSHSGPQASALRKGQPRDTLPSSEIDLKSSVLNSTGACFPVIQPCPFICDGADEGLAPARWEETPRKWNSAPASKAVLAPTNALNAVHGSLLTECKERFNTQSQSDTIKKQGGVFKSRSSAPSSSPCPPPQCWCPLEYPGRTQRSWREREPLRRGICGPGELGTTRSLI